MYSFDQPMSEIHALLAWCSVALLLLRGLAFWFKARWSMESQLRLLVFGMHVMLAVTGVSLWALRYHNPLHDGWLLAKLLALVAYAVCAHNGMGIEREQLRAGWYLAALVCLLYVLGVSITRSAWLGVF
jgi:uncharacterized membrane protein SirB2